MKVLQSSTDRNSSCKQLQLISNRKVAVFTQRFESEIGWNWLQKSYVIGTPLLLATCKQ